MTKKSAEPTASGIPVHCSHHEIKDVTALVPHPKNPNRHGDKQLALYSKIIRNNGWRAPIRISRRSGYMTKGHGALEAAKILQVEQVPVEYQDYAQEADEYADMIADNRLAELSERDTAELSGLLSKLQTEGYDTELAGFDEESLSDLLSNLEGDGDGGGAKEDEPPAESQGESLRKKWGVESGQVWELGGHRVVCGDATDSDTVDRLGKKFDVCFTDPPYGMRLDTDFSSMPKQGKRYSPVVGDDADFDPSCIFAIQADRYCIWGADWFYQRLPDGFSPIVWDKQPEHVEIGCTSHFELCWVKPAEKRRIVRKLWNGYTAKESGESRLHPTQKPVEVCVDVLGSGPETIIDPFLGSGTTLIAAEQLGRICYGIEISPEYVAITLERWANHTSKTPKLVK